MIVGCVSKSSVVLTDEFARARPLYSDGSDGLAILVGWMDEEWRRTDGTFSKFSV